MIAATLTHVAVLVQSLEKAVQYVTGLGLEINPFEEFEHEGTRECYVGSPTKSARLLLLEAIKVGPYQRALEKRGPGLHHLGVQISNLEDYSDQLGSVGWFLHTKSLVTVKKSQTAYFTRPLIPYLVEAWEHTAPAGSPSIDRIQIGSRDITLDARTQVLGIANTAVSVSHDNYETQFMIEGRKILLSTLTGVTTI